MLRRKDPKADLKLQFRKVFQLSTVVALVLLIGMFQASKRYEIRTQRVESINFQMKVDEIPPTEQMDRPPAPSRPAVPIESESEDIPEDETISTTEMDFSELPPPPPPPEQVDESAQIFVAWDEPPQPIGGFAAIQAALNYPESVRKSGIEGRVYVIAVISDKGEVLKAWAQNFLGDTACDEAAIAAVKAVKWKPAKQQGEPVTVQIGIPVIFRLK